MSSSESDPVSDRPDGSTHDAEATPRRRRRSWVRRTFFVLAALVTLLVITVAFAPALISLGLARGALLSIAGRQAGQRVQAHTLEVTWFGAQEVRGLEVGEPGSAVHAVVDVHVDSGLWDVIVGGAQGLNIRLGGEVSAELGSGDDARSAGSTGPLRLPDVRFSIDVSALDVELKQKGLDEPLRLEGVAGSLRYVPGSNLAIELAGDVVAAEVAGRVSVDAELTDAFDVRGTFTPAGARARVRVEAPDLSLSELGDQAAIRALVLQATSDDLTRDIRLTMEGESFVEGTGSPLEADLVVTTPFAADGEPQIDITRVSGTMSGRRLPSAPLQPFLSSTPLVLARDVGAYFDVAANLAGGGGEEVRVTVTGEHARLEVEAVVDLAGAMVVGDRFLLNATLQPELLSSLVGDAVQLSQPTTCSLQLEWFRFPTDTGAQLTRVLEASGTVRVDGAVRLASGQILTDGVVGRLALTPSDDADAFAIRYDIEPATLRFASESVDPVEVRSLAGNLVVRATPTRAMQTSGDVELGVSDARARIASVHYDLNMNVPADGTPVIEGRVQAPSLNLAALDEVVSAIRPAIRWTGRMADLDLAIDSQGQRWSAVLRASSARLKGSWVLRVDPETTALEAEGASIALSPAMIRDMGLVPIAQDGFNADADIILRPEIRALRWPTAIMLGEPFDPAAVDIDLALSIPTIGVRGREDQVPAVLENAQLSVSCANLSDGLKISGAADLQETEGKQAGAELELDLSGLLADDGSLSPDGVRVNGHGKMTQLPTSIIDGLLGLDDLLVAALGTESVILLRFNDLSRDSGTFYGKFRSIHGVVTIPELRGSDGRLVLAEGRPATASLRITSDFRQRLLRKLHPVFADIETSAKPVEATATEAAIPLDGDLTKLDADLDLVVGDVRFRPSVLVGLLLSQAGSGQDETIPGRIDPVRVRIRRGIVRYDRFKVFIEDYAPFTYSGTIDLVNGRLDLRHEVPVALMAAHIPEVRAFAENIMIPVVTRGPIDDPRTEIDPDFEMAGAVIQDTVNRALEDFLGIGGDRQQPPPAEQPPAKKKRRRRPR